MQSALATLRKSSAKLHEIYEEEAQWYGERNLYAEEYDQAHTCYLARQASHLGVALPSKDGWYECRKIGGQALMTSGAADLRAAIRKEKNERWAFWEVRIKVLGALFAGATGLVGALIGLVTVWK
jgi:hypothetical protein